MDTLQALDKRITTTGRLQGIVKSMKSLSAVNIRQYERALVSLAAFMEVIEMGLQTALKEVPLPRHGPAAAHPPLGIAVCAAGSTNGSPNLSGSSSRHVLNHPPRP